MILTKNSFSIPNDAASLARGSSSLLLPELTGRTLGQIRQLAGCGVEVSRRFAVRQDSRSHQTLNPFVADVTQAIVPSHQFFLCRTEVHVLSADCGDDYV